MMCKCNLSCAEKLKPVLEHYVGFAQDPLNLYFSESLEKLNFSTTSSTSSSHFP